MSDMPLSMASVMKVWRRKWEEMLRGMISLPAPSLTSWAILRRILLTAAYVSALRLGVQ